MKTNEDRMIDFVAKSYEENRFDPKKALARSQNGSLRRSLSLSKRTVMLKRIAGVTAAAAVGIFLYLSWLTSWTDYAAYDIAQTFTLPDSSSVTLAPGSTLRLQKHKDKRLVQMTGKVYFTSVTMTAPLSVLMPDPVSSKSSAPAFRLTLGIPSA